MIKGMIFEPIQNSFFGSACEILRSWMGSLERYSRYKMTRNKKEYREIPPPKKIIKFFWPPKNLVSKQQRGRNTCKSAFSLIISHKSKRTLCGMIGLFFLFFIIINSFLSVGKGSYYIIDYVLH